MRVFQRDLGGECQLKRLRQRPHLELDHHLRTVDFDGPRAEFELAGDDLVRPSAYQAVEDGTLAWRQAVDPRERKTGRAQRFVA